MNEFNRKIPSITNLATTTTALTAVENKIPNVSNLVKILTIARKLLKLKRKLLIMIMINLLLLQNLNKKIKQLILQKNVVNLFIVYELDTWSQDINGDFTLINCLFGSAKLTKNSDSEKYKYSGYKIGFDLNSFYLLPDNATKKNVIIFEADMNSSMHINNKRKDILILVHEPTQSLDNTKLTAEAIYSINFAQ